MTLSAPLSNRSPPGARNVMVMTVLAVYICMIDRIAISIAIIPMAAEHGWTTTLQGAVMSAFFLGYLILQIPAGYLSDRFGGKWVLGLGVSFWSLFTLLTPAALLVVALAGYSLTADSTPDSNPRCNSAGSVVSVR